MLPRKELDHLLRKTLDDLHLSPDEKNKLRQVFQGNKEHELRRSRNMAFDLVIESLSNPDDQALLHWLKGVVKAIDNTRPNTDDAVNQVFFSPGNNCRQAIINTLDNAKHSVDICVFTISDDRITKSIRECYQRNLQVRVISDNDKADDLGSDIDQLDALGVKVKLDKSRAHMHHKFAVIDNSILLTGSFNWTRSASSHNEENLIRCNNEELVTQYHDHFNKLWRKLHY